MVIVRKHELGKYKIITGDGMFLSPYYTKYVGKGYYKPKRQRGVGHQFRNKGDGIIDTLMGIGSTILKHKDLIGSTASVVGSVVGAIQKAQKESHKLQAIKEIKKGKTQLSSQERQKIIKILGSGFQRF